MGRKSALLDPSFALDGMNPAVPSIHHPWPISKYQKKKGKDNIRVEYVVFLWLSWVVRSACVEVHRRTGSPRPRMLFVLCPFVSTYPPSSLRPFYLVAKEQCRPFVVRMVDAN